MKRRKKRINQVQWSNCDTPHAGRQKDALIKGNTVKAVVMLILEGAEVEISIILGW